MYGQQTQGISPKSYEAVPEPSRQVEVASAASDVECNLTELEQALATLANRLVPILSAGSLNQAAPGDSPGYSCELANRLSGTTSRLRTLRTGVGELLSRLEI